MSTKPEPECPCNTIPEAGRIQVYQGKGGHVVIKQQQPDADDAMVIVLPQLIPTLVKMLEKAAEEIGEGCPEHDEPTEERTS